MAQCIVLNADYSFLNIVDWKRAVRLVVKGKVEVLKYTEEVARGIENTIKIPAVLRLIKLVRAIYRNKVPFSKKNVLIRDGFKCAYCGTEGKRLTIDHVIPRSKGGKTTFENCVAACKPCNHKKSDKLPSEVHMYFKGRPYAPTINQFLKIKLEKLGINKVINEIWE